MLAASNRQVQLCRHNKGAGLEAKQLKKIVWRIKKVSDTRCVMCGAVRNVWGSINEKIQ